MPLPHLLWECLWTGIKEAFFFLFRCFLSVCKPWLNLLKSEINFFYVQCLSPSLLALNSSSLTGDYCITIYTHLLSFVLQHIFEDWLFSHFFFFFFTRKGKHVHWLWGIQSWCNFMARRLLLPLRMSVQVLNWLTLLWNNYAFHSGTFYHAILLLCRLHVLRRYKREEQRLFYFYTCI